MDLDSVRRFGLTPLHRFAFLLRNHRFDQTMTQML